jgi:murein DD-endopeptidase MepM/ murein hydrolase activator NlpD
VDAPPLVVSKEISAFVADGPNASGYGNFTQVQLLAGGALEGVPAFQPPIKGVITTYWGGSTPWQSFHTGVDIATAKDTAVHAAAAGVVIYAGLAVPGDPTMSYGNCVVIMHNDHVTTLYGHMDMGLDGLQVHVGQFVQAGQIIGYEGQTGWATGPHVHFEMRLNNVAFDPLLLVSAAAITG